MAKMLDKIANLTQALFSRDAASRGSAESKRKLRIAPPRTKRLAFESLEDRRLLSVAYYDFYVSQDSANWGDRITLNLKGFATENETIRVYLSPDANITADDPLLASIGVSGFFGQGTLANFLTVPVDVGLFTTANVDFSNPHWHIGVIDTSNGSTRADYIYVNPGRIDRFDVSENAVNWGDQITINLRGVANGQVKIYLSPDENITPDDRTIGIWNVKGFIGSGSIPNDWRPTSLSTSLLPDSVDVAQTQWWIGVINPDGSVMRDAITINPTLTYLDSSGLDVDRWLDFGSVVDDGKKIDDDSSNAAQKHTIVLTNRSSSDVCIYANSFNFNNGKHFRITSVVDSSQSSPSSVAQTNVLKANGGNTLTITVMFDPSGETGSLYDVLTLDMGRWYSDEQNAPAYYRFGNLSFNLAGTSTPKARLEIATPSGDPSNPKLQFTETAFDANKTSTRTFTLTNPGSGVATINAGGIAIPADSGFTIQSIVSSTQGDITNALKNGAKNLAPRGAEKWTVTVVFKPTASKHYQNAATISYVDPNVPGAGTQTATVALYGYGKTGGDVRFADETLQSSKSLDFGNVHADGDGLEAKTVFVEFSNPGEIELVVDKNGIQLENGAHFQLKSIVSSTFGEIDLSLGAATISAKSEETWTLELTFDPTAAGNLTDSLTIKSNGAKNPNVQLTLNGVGLNRPELRIEIDGQNATSPLAFADVLADGSGGKSVVRYLTLTNPGAKPLTVFADGIRLSDGRAFAVKSIVSTTQGDITSRLKSSAQELAAKSAENWLVAVEFDPTAETAFADTLTFRSNDPTAAAQTFALQGSGVLPKIELTDLTFPINVAAKDAFAVRWNDEYSGGDATISLYYDDDSNPNNGKTLIKTGIREDGAANRYLWAIPESLVGRTITLYAEISDGTYSSGSYSFGALKVGPVGEYRLLSAPVVADELYELRYERDGKEYSAQYLLAPGANAVYHSIKENGEIRTYAFDVARVDSLATAERSEFDELGRLTSVSDASGAVVSCEYDVLNQLTKITYDDGETVEFAYDGVGNLTSMTDSTGVQFYEFDALNRLVGVVFSTDAQKDADDKTVRYEYDLADQLTKIVYPSGKTVEYAYDAAGRLATVSENGLETTYAYDAQTGLIASVARPNGTRTKYEFDDRYQLTKIRHEKTSDSSLLEEIRYDRDVAGRTTLAVFETPNGTRAESYVYDDFGQLSQVVYSEDDGTIESTDRTVRYVYNEVGGRVETSDDPDGSGSQKATVKRYEYGAGNRLEAVLDANGNVLTRYFYDANGNLVSEVSADKTIRYFYNAQGLLSGWTDGATVVEFEYDGAGRRTAKIVDGVRTEYALDVSASVYQTLEEYDANGDVMAQYTYGSDRISSTVDGASQYYLTDALGSVRCVATSDGSAVGYATYDAFGGVLSDPANIAAQGGFGYAGEYVDAETGLSYNRARYYDPELGRFTQKDPLGYVDSFDTYVYCAADPVNSVDPTGKTLNGWDIFTGTLNVLGLSAMYLGAATAAAGEITLAGSACLGVAVLEGGYALGNVGVKGINWISNHTIGRNVLTESQTGSLIGDVVYSVTGNQTAGNLASLASSVFTIGGGNKALSKANPHNVTPFFNKLGEYADKITASGISTYTELGEKIIKFIPENFWSTPLNSVVSEQSVTPKQNQSPVPLQGGVKYNEFIDAGDNIFINSNTFDYNNLGGVVLDQAATLVNQSLSDIQGATFDPTTGQLVFIGAEKDASTEGVNTDFLFTAIQSVYGSVVPPYVTLDPPASLLYDEFDLGAGKNVIPNGQEATLVVKYVPLQSTDEDDMTLTFTVDGKQAAFNIDGYATGISGGGRTMTMLAEGSGHSLPAGITASMVPKGTFTGSATVNKYGQESYQYIKIQNNSGAPVTIDDLTLIPNLQHRGLSVRAEDSMLGWVMYEADRVMKNLGVGKSMYLDENGAEIIYDKTSPQLPDGFQNLLELYGSDFDGEKSNRFWFSPDTMALKQYVDPETGVASMIFDSAGVKLQTEDMLVGGVADPTAQKFVDFFNEHFDEFAEIEFLCSNPSDPTGESVVSVKIFSLLRDAMKAVSLARFFHDADVPLDTWWLNSYEPETAYVPETIPTISNETGSVRMYGGVTISTPNTYIPSPVVESVLRQVVASRPEDGGDLDSQTWAITSTELGNLTAVSMNMTARRQSANTAFSTTDLSFATPGDESLAFTRYYNSGYAAEDSLGTGWSTLRYDLQFQRPSWTDELGIMRDANGEPIESDNNFDVGLREGEIRFVDYATGETLNFKSSMVVNYSLDGSKEVTLQLTGLNDEQLPTFEPGEYANGSTLEQLAGSKGYRLTRPDGSSVEFNKNGELLRTKDARGYVVDYVYDADGRLTEIVSRDLQNAALDSIWITYDDKGRIAQVAGLGSKDAPLRKVSYTYSEPETASATGSLLTKATSSTRLSDGTYVETATVEYEYDEDGRIVRMKTPSGLTALDSALNVYGQKTEQTDALGNKVEYSFGTTSDGGRTTTVSDAGNSNAISPTASGLDALRYVVSSGSSTATIDATDRTTEVTNSQGITTSYGYDGDSRYASSISLSTDGFQAIQVLRNEIGLPTSVYNPNNTQAEAVEIEYNDANLPTRTKDATGKIVVYEYTDFNAVKKITEGVGTELERSTTYNYNDAKQLASVVDALGRTVVSYTYDARGRVLSETGADGIATTYAYDELGRTTSITRLGYSANYEYDNFDQVVKTTYKTGSQVVGVETATYDPKTLALVSATDVLGQKIEYEYDFEYDESGAVSGGSGAVTSVRLIGASNASAVRSVSYDYDLKGNLVRLTTPNGASESYRYDARGNLVGTFEDDGATTAVVEASADGTRATFSTSEPIATATLRYWSGSATGANAKSTQTAAVRADFANEATFELSGATNGGSLRYELTTTDAQGNVTVSTGVLNLTQVVSPNDLTASPNRSGAIVSWSSVGGGALYDVGWRPLGTTSWNYSTTSSTTLELTSLPPETRFEVRVRTAERDDSGASEWSAPVEFTTLAALPDFDLATSNGGALSTTTVRFGETFRVSNVSVENVGANAVSDAKITFYASLDATSNGSDVELATVSLGTLASGASTTVSSGELSSAKLTAGNDYYIVWRLASSSDEIASNDVGRTTELLNVVKSKLATPTNLTVVATTSSSVSLSWTDTNANESGYRVEYKADGATAWATLEVAANATSANATGLPSGTKYEFRVKALGAANYEESDYSANVFATTKPKLASVSIRGTARVDETLTAVASPSGADASFQWYRGETPIDGATDATYTIVDADAGFALKVVATENGNNVKPFKDSTEIVKISDDDGAYEGRESFETALDLGAFDSLRKFPNLRVVGTGADWFKFTLTASALNGLVATFARNSTTNIDITLCGAHGGDVKNFISENGAQRLSFQDLEDGTYWLRVRNTANDADSETVAPYSLFALDASATVVTTAEDVVDATDDKISLREAIEYAKDGDTIVFDSTVFADDQTIVLNGTQLTIRDKSVTIDGTVGDKRIVLDADGKSRVLEVNMHNKGEGTVEIANLIATNGRVENGAGGGFYQTWGGALALTNVDAIGNVAQNGGGIDAETLILTNVVASGNVATRDGGGISAGTITATNLDVNGNSAQNGGGIYCAGEMTATHLVVAGNVAVLGGGVANYAGIMTLTNVVASQNVAQIGGGIYNYGTLTATNLETVENTAEQGGGIHNSLFATLTATNLLVAKNVASSLGGGIYASEYGTLTATNATVAGNYATQDGGGLYCDYNSAATLQNSIVARNRNAGGVDDVVLCEEELDGFDAATANAFNVLSSFDAWTNVENAIPYDASRPLFVVAPIFDENGNLTNADAIDLRLAVGSPAINAGKNDYVAGIETDLDGNARIQGGTVDLGAFESAFLPPNGSVEFLCQAASSGPGATFEEATQTARTWLDEWSNFYIDVWTTAGENDGVSSANVAFRFDPRYFVVADVEAANGFDVATQSVENGVVAATLVAKSGTNATGKTLLARIRFEPISQEIGGENYVVGGVAIPQDGVLKSVATGFAAELADQKVNGNAAKSTAAPTVALYPVNWDFNDDGKITALDFNPLTKYYGVETKAIPESDAAYRIFDVNGDGKITALDFNDFVGYWNVQANQNDDAFYRRKPNAVDKTVASLRDETPKTAANFADVETKAVAFAALAEDAEDEFLLVFEDDDDDAFWLF